jgi:hypothetical protein
MPTVNTPNLVLSESEGRVTIRVLYTVTFNRFDRQLSALGKNWHPHVTVHDFDGGDSIGAQLVDFPTRVTFPVTVGTTDQVLARDESFTVDRDVLRGDTDGKDELKAKVRIHSEQTVEAFTEDAVSDQEDLTS